MIYLIFLVVCFGASIVGAICGIGGGVIIKPVLDSFGVLDVTAISFLSGCTVLSIFCFEKQNQWRITCFHENWFTACNRGSGWWSDREMAVFLCEIFEQ